MTYVIKSLVDARDTQGVFANCMINNNHTVHCIFSHDVRTYGRLQFSNEIQLSSVALSHYTGSSVIFIKWDKIKVTEQRKG